HHVPRVQLPRADDLQPDPDLRRNGNQLQCLVVHPGLRAVLRQGGQRRRHRPECHRRRRVLERREERRQPGGGRGRGGGGGRGGGTPDPIPVCSILASTNTPTVGQNLVLSANCTGNPTQFYWTGVTCSAGQCAAQASAAGQVTYSLSGGNATGTGNVAYLTV